MTRENKDMINNMMKTLKSHINEALKIGKNLSKFSAYSCQPKTKDELEDIVYDRILKYGDDCDLNDIDTSLIDDMSYLFYNTNFDGDISRWDTSNVITIVSMFERSKFTGDISKWNVSKVEDAYYAFSYSRFNGDISKWNVSKVTDMCNVTQIN